MANYELTEAADEDLKGIPYTQFPSGDPAKQCAMELSWTLISRPSEVVKQGPAFSSVTDQSCVSHAPDSTTCSI